MCVCVHGGGCFDLIRSSIWRLMLLFCSRFKQLVPSKPQTPPVVFRSDLSIDIWTPHVKVPPFCSTPAWCSKLSGIIVHRKSFFAHITLACKIEQLESWKMLSNPLLKLAPPNSSKVYTKVLLQCTKYEIL